MGQGYTDKGATQQLAAKIEAAVARGEQAMVNPFKVHNARPLSDHVAEYVAELATLGRDPMYVYNVKTRLAKLLAECGWNASGDVDAESFAGGGRTGRRSGASSAGSATLATARVRGR